MLTPVKVGVSVPQRTTLDSDQGTGNGLTAFSRRAEELGFSHLWTVDSTIGGPSAAEPILDGLHVLSFVAAVTNSIQLGIAVIVLPHRLPLMLAKELATIDHLSGGRVILGVGLGGPVTPPAFPVELDGPTRIARLTEGIELIRQAWTEHRVTYRGELFDVEGVPIEPKPVSRRGPPVWIGGKSRTAIRRAAQLGEGWVASGTTTLQEFREQVQIFKCSQEEFERHADNLALAKRIYICVDPDRAAAERATRLQLDPIYGDGSAQQIAITGGLDACAAELQEFIELGLTDIILDPIPHSMDQLEKVAGVIRLLDTSGTGKPDHRS